MTPSDPRAETAALPVPPPGRPTVLLYAGPRDRPRSEVATLGPQLAALGCPIRPAKEPRAAAGAGPLLAIGSGRGAIAALDGAAAAGAALVVALAPKGRPAAASDAADPATARRAVPALVIVDLLDRRGRRWRRPGSGRRRRLVVRLAGLGPAGVDHLAAIGGLAAIVALAGEGRPRPARLARLGALLRRLHRTNRIRSTGYLMRIADWAAARGKRRAFRLAAERLADLSPGPVRLARLLGQAQTLGDEASLTRLLTVAGRDHPTAARLRPFLAAGGDPAVRILHDAGRSIIRYVESDPDCRRPLFVTFTGFEGGRDDRPGFGETLIRQLGCNCAAVKPVNRNNFSDLSTGEVARVLGGIAARHRQVITYGHSGGAYAALYFSAAVGADLAIAISPRNSRDPRYRRPTVEIPAEWTDSHGRLRDEAGTATAKLVVLDPNDRQDVAFYRGEIQDLPALTTVWLRHGGHPCTEHLIRAGALKPMIEGLADGRLAPHDAAALRAALIAAHRRGRGSSPGYLAHLARRLGERRKVAALTAILSRVDPRRASEPQLHRLALACHAAGLAEEERRLRAIGRERFPNSARLAHAPPHPAIAALLHGLRVIAVRLGLRRPVPRQDDDDEDG